MYIPVEFDSHIKKSTLESKTKTFKELGLRERDIEEFLRKNINLLMGEDETLLVVGQQVRTESNGISDLTAIDANGNLVLIEIKRDVEDLKARREPFEFQAIRYAASYAKIKTYDEIVDLVYSSYIEKHHHEYELSELTANEMARRNLKQFLENNEAIKIFNSKQRIMLIASSFDEQTLSAVAWLISNNVDISCFTLTPAFIGTQGFLNIEKILPPPNLDDFYIGLSTGPKSKAAKTTTKATMTRTLLPRMNKLFEWGVIKVGDKLKIKNFDNSDAEAVDANQVLFNNEKVPFNQWGQTVTGWSSINIYEWTLLLSSGKTLYQLRAEKMEDLETIEASHLVS